MNKNYAFKVCNFNLNLVAMRLICHITRSMQVLLLS